MLVLVIEFGELGAYALLELGYFVGGLRLRALLIFVREWRYYMDFIEWMLRVHEINIFPSDECNKNLLFPAIRNLSIFVVLYLTQINIILQMAKIIQGINTYLLCLLIVKSVLTLDCKPFGVRLSFGNYFANSSSL